MKIRNISLVLSVLMLSIWASTSALAEGMDEESSASNYVSCGDIYDTGAYRKQGNFTEGPFRVGCYIGQAIGAVGAIPVAAVYAPVCSAADRGNCQTYKSPLQDGAEFVGRVLGHAVGAPFFLLEMIFVGDGEDSDSSN
ncbi:MAG: hypothetical protein KDD64_15835 [Bdellovibrionales bacterium]|nr:hypothetical protein [Bdellovibrionales bacterium]